MGVENARKTPGSIDDSGISTNAAFRPVAWSTDASPTSVPDDQKLRMGLVLNRQFHEQNKWVSATTFHLVEELKKRFDCLFIQNQKDYEQNLGDIDVLASMEPGWAAPVLEFGRTQALREKLSDICSYILYSDPHLCEWRQDYFLNNNLDYVLAFYNAPTRLHLSLIHI